MYTTKQKNDGSRYVEGTIVITLRAQVPDEVKEISEEEAVELLEPEKQYYAESNDGLEMIANAQITLKK